MRSRSISSRSIPIAPAAVANAVADAYVDDVARGQIRDHAPRRRLAAGSLEGAARASLDRRSRRRRFQGRKTTSSTSTTMVGCSTSSRSASSTARSSRRAPRPRRRRPGCSGSSRSSSSDDPDPASSAAATVTDTLHNEVITKLRQQYLDLGAKEADWTARYGRNHLAVVNLRNQRREIRLSILDELRRIAETYKSEFEIAKARENSVQKSLDDIVPSRRRRTRRRSRCTISTAARKVVSDRSMIISCSATWNWCSSNPSRSPRRG